MMSRNRTVDITRGITILAIIAGHLNIWSINRIVFTFHVPVFYLLTGSDLFACYGFGIKESL